MLSEGCFGASNLAADKPGRTKAKSQITSSRFQGKKGIGKFDTRFWTSSLPSFSLREERRVLSRDQPRGKIDALSSARYD